MYEKGGMARVDEPVVRRGIREVRRKLQSPGQLSIAHISDLHFSGNTAVSGDVPEAAKWLRLREAVVRQRPDLIVVTGDIVDSPSDDAFQRAQQFLLDMCEACELVPKGALFVVPGNHDYRFKGMGPSFGRPIFRKYFSKYMRPHVLRFEEQKRAELEIAIFCLDTNRGRGGLADGNVLSSDLHDCRAFLDDPRVASAYSIVLMHHHPAPVVRSENRGDVDREPGMILKNAGTVLDTLVRHSADLVLHGHKHWDGVTHIGGAARDVPLAIVAAGSAGKQAGERVRFNRVSVSRSHVAHVAGQSAIDGNEYEGGQPVSVFGSYAAARPRRRHRMHSRLIEKFPWHATTLQHNCVLRRNGDIQMVRSYRALRLVRGSNSFLPISIRSSMATKPPRVPTFDRMRGDICYTWGSESRDTGIVFGVDIQRPSADGMCGDFAMTTSLEDAFSWSVEDKRRAIADRPVDVTANETIAHEDTREWLDFHHKDVLADQLIVTLTMPREIAQADLIRDVSVIAYDYSSFPEGEQKFTLLELIDEDETNHARRTLFESGLGQYTLYVDRPLPGFRYRVEWLLPSRKALSSVGAQ